MPVWPVKHSLTSHAYAHAYNYGILALVQFIVNEKTETLRYYRTSARVRNEFHRRGTPTAATGGSVVAINNCKTLSLLYTYVSHGGATFTRGANPTARRA